MVAADADEFVQNRSLCSPGSCLRIDGDRNAAFLMVLRSDVD